MECYIEVGGVPMVSNREHLIDLLRHEMGFEVSQCVWLACLREMGFDVVVDVCR